MASFWDRLMGRAASKGTRYTAKERLQFVLVHDRINLPPERMQAMKEEILAVISKYVSVDLDNVDIALQQRDRHKNLLVAEIPFSGSRAYPTDSNDEDSDLQVARPKPKASGTAPDTLEATEIIEPLDMDSIFGKGSATADSKKVDDSRSE